MPGAYWVPVESASAWKTCNWGQKTRVQFPWSTYLLWPNSFSLSMFPLWASLSFPRLHLGKLLQTEQGLSFLRIQRQETFYNPGKWEMASHREVPSCQEAEIWQCKEGGQSLPPIFLVPWTLPRTQENVCQELITAYAMGTRALRALGESPKSWRLQSHMPVGNSCFQLKRYMGYTNSSCPHLIPLVTNIFAQKSHIL